MWGQGCGSHTRVPSHSRAPPRPSPSSLPPLQPHPLQQGGKGARGESWPQPPPPPYKKEIDFCLEFVKSGVRDPVNGAPRGAG